MKKYIVYMPQFDSIIETDFATGFCAGDEVELEIGGIKLGTGFVVGEL